jgi:hypothetical protein
LERQENRTNGPRLGRAGDWMTEDLLPQDLKGINLSAVCRDRIVEVGFN